MRGTALIAAGLWPVCLFVLLVFGPQLGLIDGITHVVWILY